MKQKNQNDSPSRDRSGMSTVEFALLLPFFALLAAGVFSLGHLVYRSICQSHIAFSTARRCAVRGSAGFAERWVKEDYRACSIPEEPQVSAQYMPGMPGVCRITLLDRAPLLSSTRRGRLDIQYRRGASAHVVAAGTSLPMGGDNDL